MIVAISRAVLEQILAHAEQSPAEEVCGLLFGDEYRVIAACPAANIAEDRTAFFELDPAVLLASHRAARQGGRAVIGHYHSHPNGDAMPSERDAADAKPGCFWLIVAGNLVQMFSAVAGGPIHGMFCHVTMQVD